MAKTYVYWVLMPAGSSTGSAVNPTRPKGTEIFKVIQGSAIDNKLINYDTVTIAGKKWQPFMVGSFPTLAAARQASPPSGLTYIGSVVGASIGAGASADNGINTGEVTAGGNAGAKIGSEVESLGHFLNDLTQRELWIRIGKIVLGGTLLLIGLVKLTGADQKIGGVAAKATKLAPFL